LIPLYPHYSTTTTKSSLEDFEACYHKSGMDALLFEVKHYFQNTHYNRAIIETIQQTMQGEVYEDFDLIFSAHGLPQKIVDSGDVYQKHIEKHTNILKKLLQEENMNFHGIHLAYQSKVGPMKWLEPSLEAKLKTVRNKGVIIYPIAFTIDNSETDYELRVEYKEIAQELGFKKYKVSPCPNDSDYFVEALCEIYQQMRR
jgi:ferrochelatase